MKWNSVVGPEERISLPQLARAEGVSPVTVWRWALRGIKGIRLRTGCIGGTRRYTTEGWYADFCEAVTAARTEGSKPTTTRQRESAIDRAEAELARIGA